MPEAPTPASDRSAPISGWRQPRVCGYCGTSNAASMIAWHPRCLRF